MDKLKKNGLIRVLVFCLFIFTCVLVSALVPQSDYSDRENRELQKLPGLTAASFVSGEFQEKYEKYVNDHIILRDELADMSVNVQVCLGRKDVNNVYVGKDGYLIEKLSEEYDNMQLEDNIAILAEFIDYAVDEYGKNNVRCMMIPSKAEVLTDKLPAYAENKDRKLISSLYDSLKNREVLIDLSDTMRQHQNEYIYYRTDHHWTTLGAGYAYEVYCESVGNEPDTDFNNMTEKFSDFYGTTYNKAHVNVPADTVCIYNGSSDNVKVCLDDESCYDTMYFEEAALEGFNRYNLFLAGNTFKIVIDTDAGRGKTLLLIKDSFANCFVPYLTNDYDRIIMIDYRYGKTGIGSILDEYEDISDVLVMYNTDKFVTNNKLARLGDISRKADREDNSAGTESVEDDRESEDSGLEEFDIDNFLEETE